MKFPSYEDFLETLTSDRIGQYVEDAGAEIDDTVGKLPIPNTESNTAAFSTALGVLSAKIAALMLRDYHVWLSSNQGKR